MRLRGLVFERFVTFERAEVNVCDESGAPLDVVLFVGESGAGKSALLRGVSGLLSEAVGAGEELGEHDVRRTADSARCRVVFDDAVDGGRVIVTLEKEIAKGAPAPSVRATPAESFDRWRRAIEQEAAPRAAFSIAGGDDDGADGRSGNDATDPELGDGDPLFEWLLAIRGGPKWDGAVRALDRVLWPYSFDHVTTEGDLVFSSASGLASSAELGDAFESVLVMTLELLRLTTDRPDEELVYVIDDIDAHLHPRWQARIIGDLRRAFPRVQLVATTHSPYVVASVEPHHVFRIEGPSGSRPGSIVRVADRVQRSSPVSQVMDLAFGAPDLPGPRWAHVPHGALRREALATIDADLPRGAVVHVLPEPLHIRDVRNAFAEQVLPTADGSTGYLFFVDHEPGAAWGHSCEYVFVSQNGKVARQSAIWPPANLDRFVPVARG